MNERDELIIKHFMEAHREPLPDNGFTERVMDSLPYRIKRVTWAVNIATFVLCTLLFYWFGGFDKLHDLAWNFTFIVMPKLIFPLAISATLFTIAVSLLLICRQEHTV